MILSVAFTKRIIDVLLSLLILILTSPVILLISALIHLDSPGPIFYREKRIARYGNNNSLYSTTSPGHSTFVIYKFRTMTDGAELFTGPVHAIKNDIRVTRVGKVLRKYRLDEIPNFFNVLKGDMSIVGPRADRIEDRKGVEHEFPIIWERTRFVKPGITGWAQVVLRSNGTIASDDHPLLQCTPHSEKEKPVMSYRYKLYYDFAYAAKMMNFWSFLITDLQIIMLTPYIMFFKQNTI